MEYINVTAARKGFFDMIGSVNSTHKPIYIASKNGSAVLISEDDWRAIEETLHLNNVPGLVDAIKDSEREPMEDMVNADEVDWE